MAKILFKLLNFSFKISCVHTVFYQFLLGKSHLNFQKKVGDININPPKLIKLCFYK